MPSPATHTHPGPRDVTNPQEFPQLPGGFPILGNSATGETIGEKDMDTAEEIRSIRQEIAEMKKSIRQEIAELKKMIMENKSDRVDKENVRSDDVSDVSDVENTNEVSDIIITHVRSDDVSDVSDADNTNEVSDIIITHGGPSENSDDSDRKNDADEDAKETADLWDITQKMLSGTDYAYSINTRKARKQINKEDTTQIRNAVQEICRLKSFIKQKFDQSVKHRV